MDFAGIIEALKRCNSLLTVTELAIIFDVHFSTIDRWLLQVGFPKPIGRDRTRLFRPDQVIIWTQQQADIAGSMLTMEQVCERVGTYADKYSDWVKQGYAPAPRRREIGSGRHLWDAQEVAAFIEKEQGGFRRPQPFNKPPRNIKTTPHGRRGPKQHDKATAVAKH